MPPLDHRDQLIRDRLWEMKKAAIDIMNLTNIEMPDGCGCCDSTCGRCLLSSDDRVTCLGIFDIAVMEIPEVP
jgi:hypothetical protein